MARAVVAKILCTSKGVQDNGSVVLSFKAAPHSAEVSNEEWAYAEPTFGLTTLVKAGVGEQFEEGQVYTATLERDTSAAAKKVESRAVGTDNG